MFNDVHHPRTSGLYAVYMPVPTNSRVNDVPTQPAASAAWSSGQVQAFPLLHTEALQQGLLSLSGGFGLATAMVTKALLS